jgi:hypothetical protein
LVFSFLSHEGKDRWRKMLSWLPGVRIAAAGLKFATLALPILRTVSAVPLAPSARIGPSGREA